MPTNENISQNTTAEYNQEVGEKSGETNKFTLAAAGTQNIDAEIAAKDKTPPDVNIFNGVTGFSGFYKAYDGLLTAIAFQRAGSMKLLDASFLVQSLQVTWNRSIQLQRVLNNTKPIAMIGVGNGSLTLRGMIGTYGAFAGLVEDDSKENVCYPLSAVIASGTGFIGCTDDGKQQDMAGVGINLSNLLLTGITYTHQFAGAGDIMLQEAHLNFQIGGMGLFPFQS